MNLNSKIVHEGNGHLEINTRPQVIDRSRPHLLLRWDILQKRSESLGAPVMWKPRPVFTYVGIGSTSDRTTHPTIQQITRRPASHKEVRLHSECQWLQALTHELPLRQKPIRGRTKSCSGREIRAPERLNLWLLFFLTAIPVFSDFTRFLCFQKLNSTMKTTLFC